MKDDEFIPTRRSLLTRLRAWDTEWEQRLWKAALARLKRRLKPKQFQMFDLYVIKEWPVKEVARALNVSATLVYVNKHRVQRLLKRELGGLQATTDAER